MDDKPKFQFAGINIIKDAALPEAMPLLQLSDQIDVSPAFRRDYDLWLERTFGTAPAVFFIKSRLYGVVALMNTKIAQELEQALREQLFTGLKPHTKSTISPEDMYNLVRDAKNKLYGPLEGVERERYIPMFPVDVDLC